MENNFNFINPRFFNAFKFKSTLNFSGKIKIKKIPQMLLGKCEFGKDNYNLNIINPPVYEDEEDEDDE